MGGSFNARSQHGVHFSIGFSCYQPTKLNLTRIPYMNKTDSYKPQVCLSAFPPTCPSAQRSPSHHRPADQPGLTRSNRSPRPTWKAKQTPPSPNPDDSEHAAQHQQPNIMRDKYVAAVHRHTRPQSPKGGAVYRTPHAARAGRPLGSLEREHDRHRRQSAHRGGKVVSGYMHSVWCMYEAKQRGGKSSQQGSMRGRLENE